jgi:hypothetical protein
MMADTKGLTENIFAVSDSVRYVAVYDNGELTLRQREGIANSSSSESDKYEELIVNPTILKIATQRGNIDCGGLDYVVLKYGSFFLITMPTPTGHVSVGTELDADPIVIEASVRPLLR